MDSNKKMRKKYSLLTNINFLTKGVWIIAVTIIFAGLAIAARIGTATTQDFAIYIVLAIGMPWFILGFSVIIVRKEFPRYRLPNIRGWWAVFQGMLGLILTIGAEIYLIYMLIKGIRAMP